MSRRAKRLLIAALFLAAVSVSAPLLIRWSRPCDEERARARQAWTDYAVHLDGTSGQAAAVAVLDRIGADLDAALDRADLTTPAPGDERGADLYREAMERLALAQGACQRDP